MGHLVIGTKSCIRNGREHGLKTIDLKEFLDAESAWSENFNFCRNLPGTMRAKKILTPFVYHQGDGTQKKGNTGDYLVLLPSGYFDVIPEEVFEDNYCYVPRKFQRCPS